LIIEQRFDKADLLRALGKMDFTRQVWILLLLVERGVASVFVFLEAHHEKQPDD
jgi:hypothetical protein